MNFNLNHLLIWAYMSRNFSSTVFVLAQKQFSINFGITPSTDVRTTILQNRSTPNTLWFQLQKIPLY
jgi:hypothetical protein